MERAPRVVVVDHHDSHTWALVPLVAAVTGLPPEVEQHDPATAAQTLMFDGIVLSCFRGHPTDPVDFAVGGEVLRAAAVRVHGVQLHAESVLAEQEPRLVASSLGGAAGRPR